MSKQDLVFVPLGGVGEIGMNLALYGFGNPAKRKWIMVDCGVTFPGPDLPGVDLVLPDIRFAQELGANPITFLGLAGVGDLILTCTSDLSRNFRLGHLVGSGVGLKTALREIGQVVEGVNTLRLVKSKIEELNIDMPLV